MPAICGWYLPVCTFTAGFREKHGGGKLGNCPCSLSVGSLPGHAVFLASCCLHMLPLLCPHMTPFWLHCWDDPLMELQYYSLSTESLHPMGIKSCPWALSISCYFLQVFSLSLSVMNTIDVVLSSTPYGVSQRALGAALLFRSSVWGESFFSSFRGSRMYREDGCKAPANSAVQERGVEEYSQRRHHIRNYSCSHPPFPYHPRGSMILKALVFSQQKRWGKVACLLLH